MTDAPALHASTLRMMSQPETGVLVFATDGGRSGLVDLAHLTRESLIAWLRSSGDARATPLREGADPSRVPVNAVLRLLGHELEP